MSAVVCRVCATEQTQFVHMFNLYYGPIPATKFIKDVFQIDVDSDRNILVICNNCNMSLINFYRFYDMVKRAQIKYDQMFTNNHTNFQYKMEFVDESHSNNDVTTENEDAKQLTDTINNVNNIPVDHLQNNEKVRKIFFIVPKAIALNHRIIKAANCQQRTKSNDAKILEKKLSDDKSNEINTIESSEDVNNDLNSESENFSANPSSSKANSASQKPMSKAAKQAEYEARKKQYKKVVVSQRVIDATKSTLEKYKLEDIVKGGRFLLKDEEVDEIVTLFCETKCNVCKDGTIFPSYSELATHSLLEHKHPPRLECCERPLLLGSLKRHIIKHHLDPLPPKVPCKVCNKMIKRMTYRIHLSRHLPSEKRPHQCQECDRGFYLASHLKSHVEIAHTREVAQCEQCSKVCKNKASLRIHMKRAHSRALLCPVCGKILMDLKNFQNHVDGHKGIQERFKCGICNAIIRMSSKDRHMRAHRSKVEKCPLCPFETKAFLLNSHIKRVHGEKPFSCLLCPKKCFLAKELKDHVASRHTGIPKYSCEFCGRTFMNNGNYHTHRVRMHPKECAEKMAQKNKEINIDDLPVIMTDEKKSLAQDDRAGILIDVLEKARSKRYMLESLPTI